MTDNTKISTEPYKGVRDFYPEDMVVQNYIFDTWKKVAKSFGYQEYSASLLEPAELYRSKGNDEIVNDQMFTFKDRGDREVALRPEMTPSLARMVAAQRKSLKFPLRWFSIPNVFRYEKPQRGRKREHWQFNADVMGIAGVEAEVEILSLAHAVMKEFGAKNEDFEIRISNRKLIGGIANLRTFATSENPEEIQRSLIRILDGWHKRPESESNKMLEDLKIPTSIRIADYFLPQAHKNLDLGVNELITELNKIGIANAKFDPSVVRGFDYYTGMVFEVFDTDPANNRSLFGGGRYDNLLEIFGVEPIPTVGCAMGDITMRDFLETHNLPLK